MARIAIGSFCGTIIKVISARHALACYLSELERAVVAGLPVHAYFAWSLSDNFEWSDGYRYRFGLVPVDYATQQPTHKDSAVWDRDFIRSPHEAVRLPPVVV